VAVYLARFTGSSREHTESDLRCFLTWSAGHGLDPLAARRPQLELYIRWMQEIRRFKPSTVSRRFSVTAGFYRTCVIDGLLEHSPAEHFRRPSVPAESPTLGFTHLQFEALLTAARQSAHPCDFALVAMLGLLGLRIATGPEPGRLPNAYVREDQILPHLAAIAILLAGRAGKPAPGNGGLAQLTGPDGTAALIGLLRADGTVLTYGPDGRTLRAGGHDAPSVTIGKDTTSTHSRQNSERRNA
jgi:hypothetical protein